MKKLLIMLAAVGVLYSCGGNTQKSQEDEKASVSEFSDIAKNMGDGHNAQNSLDYKGTYTGKMPTAGGEGMIVSLTLGDSTFTKKVEYVGEKEGNFEEKGKYTWNSEGNTVILDGVKDSPNQYLVGENTLTQLDMEGNKIAGENAEMYILKK